MSEHSAVLTERTPRVAAARKLLRRAAREDTGRFLLEGIRPAYDAVTRAEDDPGAVTDLFVTEPVADRERDLLIRAREAGIRTALVTEKALAGLTDTVHPQGLVLVCRQPRADLPPQPRLVAVLVDVADPGNAGTVIRTADAAGADAVLLVGDSVDPSNPTCVRASMGSLFHLPVLRARVPDDGWRRLRDAGLALVVADGGGETELGPATDDLLVGPTAWILGSEAHGVPAEVAEQADHRVRVPIRGRAESLNLATAAAVCLYASARAHETAHETKPLDPPR
ncbi:TrmH family RNA methyltransferase [Actinomycetospora soli]|uniref:TrmH family RNA methyltransferase n=1 Tax=Actinomycetospora soli TaxID=2893887 RepID=UPI001E5783BC|nr:RNA methyltransferase [Actinomycetospora soli]MCD2190037.1 RNA methyltransferase [Actinomycetospora soli]